MMLGHLPRVLGRRVGCQRFSRSIVTQSFGCEAVWDQRLDSEVLKRIRPSLPEFFSALDKKFVTELTGSALDVDIFANCVDTESELEHMEELLYKLRRTPHTVYSPESTNHAVIRALVRYGTEREHLVHLLKMLDDRLNYGLFLDSYTAVLLLDFLIERGELAGGARVA